MKDEDKRKKLYYAQQGIKPSDKDNQEIKAEPLLTLPFFTITESLIIL